jgi:hypothetical protein
MRKLKYGDSFFDDLTKSFINFDFTKVFSLMGFENNLIFEGEFVIFNILSYIIEEN